MQYDENAPFNSGTMAEDWERYNDAAGLDLSERFARYTDPALMQDPLSQGLAMSSPDAIYRDFQSLGAILLNNLAAKMSGLLFPMDRPNFRLVANDELKKYAGEQGWDESQLNASMAALEQQASDRLYYGNSYVKLQRAVKLCIVTGGCVMYRDAEMGSFVVWNRHSYRMRRDPFGRVTECIIKQRFEPNALPNAFKEDVLRILESGRLEQAIDIYTRVSFKESTIPNMPRIATIMHEVEGKLLPSSVSTFPEHLCPIYFPVWSVQDGEHYGRGLVETMSGDFAKLSALSEQLALYEIDSLSMLNVVDTASANNLDSYRTARTGQFVEGPPQAITAYDRGDYNKIAAISSDLSALERRLSQAFMYAGTQRDSERTTALEVSLVAQEADAALGGAYSQLAESMQAPAAYLTLSELGDEVANTLINRHYRPVIMSGAQALNRAGITQRLVKVAQYAQAAVQVLTTVDRTLDPTKLLTLIATNEGINLDEFKKTPEQLRQEAEAQQAQAAAQAQASSALLQQSTDAQAALQ